MISYQTIDAILFLFTSLDISLKLSMGVVFVRQFLGLRVTPWDLQWSQKIDGLVVYLVKFEDSICNGLAAI
jgi:hypothetical protein